MGWATLDPTGTPPPQTPGSRSSIRRGPLVEWILAVSVLLPACTVFASAPPPPNTMPERLDLAELRISEDRPGAALALIPRDPEELPRGLRDRGMRIRAEAQLADGEAWAAYVTLRRFPVDYPLSEERPRVVEILYRAGESLITQDTSWYVNAFSDYGAKSGEAILEHLVTSYPYSNRVADAYRLRGDWRLRRGEFEDANDQFRSLVFTRSDSEWTPYALYQIAMSQFFQLSGPEYDLQEIQLARQELLELLRNPPERPDFQASAQQALATVNLWISQRHLKIADYYARVGNLAGEKLHLERAMATGPDLEPGQAAAARLAAMQNPTPQGDANPSPVR